MKQVTIYTLSCPIEKTIKYVGGTSVILANRLLGHISTPPNKNMKEWVYNLKEHNEIPIIEEIDCYDNESAAYFERYWIMQLKSWGYKLLNMSLPYERYKYTRQQILQTNNVFELEKITSIHSELYGDDPIVKKLIEMYEEEEREEKKYKRKYKHINP